MGSPCLSLIGCSEMRQILFVTGGFLHDHSWSRAIFWNAFSGSTHSDLSMVFECICIISKSFQRSMSSFFQQQSVRNPHRLSIGIDVDAAGIGISTSIISVSCRSIPVPDQAFIPVLDWFRNKYFFHSGTALTGCRTIRHSENLYKGRGAR
jgi:hypothetical protein